MSRSNFTLMAGQAAQQVQQVVQTARGQVQALRAQARASVQAVRASLQAARQTRGGLLGGMRPGGILGGGILGGGGGAAGGVLQQFGLGFQNAGGLRDRVLTQLSQLESRFRQRGMTAAADRLAMVRQRVLSGALAPGAAAGILGGLPNGGAPAMPPAAPIQERQIAGLEDELLTGETVPVRQIAGL